MGINQSQIKNLIAKELALRKTKGLTRQMLVEVICTNLRTSLKSILVLKKKSICSLSRCRICDYDVVKRSDRKSKYSLRTS